MALLTYRMIVKAALTQGVTVGVASVQVANASATVLGNHAFVLVGTGITFRTLLAANPPHLTVPATAVPATWGTDVAVVDPWIDDGGCATFPADGLTGGGRSLWADYLVRVAAQADCKATAQAIRRGNISLLVLDSITVTHQG